MANNNVRAKLRTCQNEVVSHFHFGQIGTAKLLKFAHMAKKPKRPRDPNELAKFITDIVVGDRNKDTPSDDEGKNKAAVELGRSGGIKGGKARAKKLTSEQRSEIAKKAAEKRWRKS